MLSRRSEVDLTPPNVQETVKFDILGDRKLQFTDQAVWYFTEEMMVAASSVRHRDGNSGAEQADFLSRYQIGRADCQETVGDAHTGSPGDRGEGFAFFKFLFSF